jgi:hypothetical protein
MKWFSWNGIVKEAKRVRWPKGEDLLKNSKKLKSSIIKGDPLLSTEDILADLTKEEIYILREDIEIDNYLISNGLSFSTINKETIKRLLSEVELFNIYEIATINEFANNYNKIEELANNDSFVTIYIDKLDDDYHYFNKLFKHFSLEQVQNILKTKPNKNVLLHLVKDAEKNIQSYLLQTKEIFDTIKENANEDILMKLPKETLYKIFANKRNIFKGINLNILEKFSKKDLERLFNDNKTMYKEFLSSLNTFTEDTLLLLPIAAEAYPVLVLPTPTVKPKDWYDLFVLPTVNAEVPANLLSTPNA